MRILQANIPPIPESTDLSGKTAIVTGANVGLGFAAALQLAQFGASTLVLAVRTISKGQEARDAILRDRLVREKNPEVRVLVWKVDMALHSSVVDFAEQANKELERLDILLLNAGIIDLSWKLSAQASKNTIPSDSSVCGHFNERSKYSPTHRYGDSKILLMMWVNMLATRVDLSQVIVNAMCPGMVATNLSRNLPIWLGWLTYLIFPWRARNPTVGARALLYTAALAGKESQGKLLINSTKITSDEPFMLTLEGEKIKKKVWEEIWATAEGLVPGAQEAAHLN